MHSISQFVRHIYYNCSIIQQDLTEQQAQTEVLAILEEGYRSSFAFGFYAAYLEAADPNQDNLSEIFSRIVQIIIDQKRRATQIGSTAVE